MMIDYNDFNAIVLAYKQKSNERNGKNLGKKFDILFERIMKFLGVKFDYLRMEKRNIIFTCFERTSKYDPQKVSAFNFFVTLILNQIRQINLKKSENERKFGRFVCV